MCASLREARQCCARHQGPTWPLHRKCPSQTPRSAYATKRKPCLRVVKAATTDPLHYSSATNPLQRVFSWFDLGYHQNNSQPHSKELTFLQLLGKVLRLAGPDVKLLAPAGAFLVIGALSDLAIPHFTTKTIFAVASGAAKSVLHKNITVLAYLALGHALFSAARGTLFGIVSTRLSQRLRAALFTVLIRQPISFFDSTDVGTLTSRLNSDCQAISSFTTNVNVVVRNGIPVIVGTAYLAVLSWQLTALVVACFGLLWTVTLRYGKYSRNARKLSQDVLAQSTQTADEALSQSRLVRAYGTERAEESRYVKCLRKLESIGQRQSSAWGLYIVSAATAHHASRVLTLLIGGTMLLQGSISAEQLTAFVFYVENITSSSLAVCDQVGTLYEALGAGERVLSMLDDPPAPQLSAGKTWTSLEGHVRFQNVSFNYETRPDAAALSGVCLTLEPRKLTALVGRSGSGKSTLVALLQRLYDPSEGQVLIDGHDLRDIDSSWFRSQLAVVSQEPRMFGMDVASNIAYGCGPSSQADIVAAATAANAHDFIMALPEGYATPITDKLLSGGQKQRLALSRALLKQPKLLILDEATSALDAESEAQVQAALDAAMRSRSRTVVVIAHRLSTVRNADTIIVLDKGKVAEQGTHSELCRLRGIYWSLVKRQQQGLAATDRDLSPHTPEPQHSSRDGAVTGNSSQDQDDKRDEYDASGGERKLMAVETKDDNLL